MTAVVFFAAYLKIHTKNMTISKRVDTKKVIKKMNGMTGAEIKACCTEAGYHAIRESRITIQEKDFLNGIKKVLHTEGLEGEDYMRMFG